jgi:hypothetical protein
MKHVTKGILPYPVKDRVMPKLEDPVIPAAGSLSRPIPAGESDWESEGGAVRARPDLRLEQPRLYAGLLAEADRRRRIADRIVVQGLFEPRGH